MSKDEQKAHSTDALGKEHIIAILDIDRTSAVEIDSADSESAYTIDSELIPYLDHLDHRMKADSSLSVNVAFNTDRRLQVSARSMLKIFFSGEDGLDAPTTTRACIDLASEIKSKRYAFGVDFLSSCDTKKRSFLKNLLIPFEQTIFLMLGCYALKKTGGQDYRSVMRLLDLIVEIERITSAKTKAQYRQNLFDCVFGDIQSHVDAIVAASEGDFVDFRSLLEQLEMRLASSSKPRLLADKINDFLEGLDSGTKRFFTDQMRNKIDDLAEELKPLSATLESFYMAVRCPKTAQSYKALSEQVANDGKIPSTLSSLELAPGAQVSVFQFDDSNKYLKASAKGASKRKLAFRGLLWEQRFHHNPALCIRTNAIAGIKYLCSQGITLKRSATPCLEHAKSTLTHRETKECPPIAG